jgi:hypothetical protein
MKKLMLILILTFVFIRSIAPVTPHEFIIVKSEPIYIFNLTDPLTRAVAYIESRFKSNVINKKSGARGLMQITPVMIKEVNKICKKLNLPNHYTWTDAFDPYKSIEIWNIVQNYKNPEHYIDKACRIWFGIGVQYDGKTWEDYYTEIIKIIENEKTGKSY